MTVLTPEPVAEERAEENILRPRRLADFPGQNNIKALLTVSIEAAKIHGNPVPHTLFYGPPGLGKTTLAGIIANELGRSFHVTSAPAIRRSEELVSFLTDAEDGDVMFIDEIHRLPMPIEESLYSAMEDGVVDVILGKGSGARPFRFNLPRITIVGATTRMGSISEPLRDRFVFSHRLELYNVETLTEIVMANSVKVGSSCDEETAAQIAKRARGTPRIANRLLTAAFEYATVFNNGAIRKEGLAGLWKLLGLDENGLDDTERRLLKALSTQPSPVGLGTLAALTDESEETLADALEPHLMQLGLMSRTPQGRIITDAGRRYIADAATG